MTNREHADTLEHVFRELGLRADVVQTISFDSSLEKRA